MTYLQVQSELISHGLDPSLTWAILDEEELEAWAEGSWEEEDDSEDGQ